MRRGRLAVGRTVARFRGCLRPATVTDDAGNALVEFLGAALILLIPTLYLVVTLGRVQAATFASESAAKEAGRALSLAESFSAGSLRAEAAVGLALADQGFEAAAAGGDLTISCSAVQCLAPGSDVTTTVRIEVPLPGLGGADWLPLSVPVSARATTPVDQFKEAG